MARPHAKPSPLPLPPKPDLSVWPRRLIEQQCRLIAEHYCGPIGPRTIRNHWGLEWKVFNDRYTVDTGAFWAECQRRLGVDSRPRGKPLRAKAAEAQATA
jgi:hypothetical protein